MTFLNPPVATVRIYNVTHRDLMRREQRGHAQNFCSWWSLCHRW
jgi:hypothetical protein